jgi:hypothetical protein
VPAGRLGVGRRLRLDPPRTVQRVDAIVGHLLVGTGVETEHSHPQSLDPKYFDIERLASISLDVKTLDVKEW